MKNRTATVLLALLLSATGSTVAFAQPQSMAAPRDRAQISVQRVSLDQAVVIAQRQVPGRVIGADTRGFGGRVVHEVRILESSGTLRIVRVDGESGRILR